MNQSRLPSALLLLAILIFPAWALVAQTKDPPRVRAKTPPLEPAKGTFFDDVFAEGVIGERPNLSNVAKTPGGGNTPVASTGGGETAPSGDGFAWSKIISPTTLEDEVKASKLILEQEVSTPSQIAGSGYKGTRKQMSVLAMMFAIIGEYDGDVRWKKDGPAAREVFSRTAANSKVGTVQVFNEAKQRKIDLEDLLNGSGIKNPVADVETKATWNKVTDRSPLMQRLEVSHLTRMQPWIGNKGEFSDHSEEMFHEAQLVAAFAEILLKEGMEDADDTDYADYAKRMRQAALDIVDAVKTNNYDKARTAVGEIDKSCTECHQSYRA
jgi:hypothetical protein